MSHIDHPTAKQVSAGGRGRNGGSGSGVEKGWNRGERHLPPGQALVGDNSGGSVSDRSRSRRSRASPTKRPKRRASAGRNQRRRQQQQQQEQDKEKERRPSYRPAAPPDAAVAASQPTSDPVTAQTDTGGSRHNVTFVPPPSPSGTKTANDLASEDVDGDARAPRIEGKEGGDELRGEAAAAAAAGARPDGRRGNSRGGPEGTGGSGLEGTARDFQRPSGEGRESRRESSQSEDMEFPIQSQALPDWADTIKVWVGRWIVRVRGVFVLGAPRHKNDGSCPPAPVYIHRRPSG